MTFRLDDGDKDKFDESLHYPLSSKFDHKLHYAKTYRTPVLPEDRLQYYTKKELECKSLYFNGTSDYIDCGTDPTLNFGTGDFSVVCKFKAPYTGVGGRFILQKETFTGGTVAGYSILIVGGGGVRAVVCDGATDVDISSVASYADDKWHHLVVTWSSTPGILRIYVDGIDIRNNPGSPIGNIDSAFSTCLGGGLSQFFKGSLKQFLIYKRLLSPSEVVKLSQNQSISTTNLVLDIPITSNYNSKKIIKDISGNNNHGTLHGCKWNCNFIRKKYGVI